MAAGSWWQLIVEAIKLSASGPGWLEGPKRRGGNENQARRPSDILRVYTTVSIPTARRGPENPNECWRGDGP